MDELTKICTDWRKIHPSCSDWSDTEVTEAMLIRLCDLVPKRFTSQRGADGVLRFTIKRKGAQ